MEKWADKLICAVKKNLSNTHIDKIRYRVFLGEYIGDMETEMTREKVISEIKSGITFCTITKSKDREGYWNKGAIVIIDKVNGVEFIKTVADQSKVDNLDNLPRF